MKILVLCGMHGNETGAIRVFNDLKKNDYAELREAAGRHFDGNKITFLNVEHYSPHSMERKFAKEYPIKKLLEIYKRHMHTLPEAYRGLLGEYIGIWENKKLSEPEELERARGESITMLKKSFGRFHKGRDPGEMHVEEKARKEMAFIFPKELHEIVYYPKQDQTPEAYERIPMVRKELEKAGGRAFIIDLHSSRGRMEVPLLAGDIYLPREKNRDAGELKEMLSKHALFYDDLRWQQPTRDFGFMQIEIVGGAVERKISNRLYKEFDSMPNVIFLDLLYTIFTGAVKEIMLSPGSMFYRMAYDTRNRALYTDSAFYKTNEFKTIKRDIAKIIVETAEWSG